MLNSYHDCTPGDLFVSKLFPKIFVFIISVEERRFSFVRYARERWTFDVMGFIPTKSFDKDQWEKL